MPTKSAVIGIDLGTSDSYVAFISKTGVDVVQNEVSKRATPTLVGFTDRERLLGDAALAQIKSNAKNTCRSFKHILGRNLQAPDLEKESFWSTSKLVTTAAGLAGYEVTYKGQTQQFSAIEVFAMYLTKLKQITEKWCQAKVADVVLSVPSYFSGVQRQAMLDAARVAGLSVRRVMNEHTATALAYGLDRSNDLDAENPTTVAFCSMGHALFSVSIVQFVRGKLKVLCERCELVGGRDMDECLMREFAAQFKKQVGADPLSNKKAAFKLEDSVTKTKKILSANSEATISVECLMEDEDLSSNITRAEFEKMCEPVMTKAKAVLDAVIAESHVPLDQIDFVEIVGGASRVPWVKKMCSEAFGGKELSTTMNQEESVARGCALQAAILSPLYRVRKFAVQETSPFPINVGWIGCADDAAAVQDEDFDNEDVAFGVGTHKTVTVFPSGSNMNLLKLMTFYRTTSFDVKAEYAQPETLLPLTPKDLGTFKVELPEQTEPKKVKVKARLTLHGTFSVEGAQLVEEEEYEETVKEKRELSAEECIDNSNSEMQEAGSAQRTKADQNNLEGEAKKDETLHAEKRHEWVDVVERKTRTKRTDLKVDATNLPGLSHKAIQEFHDDELTMQAEMKEIVETDERRNDLEGYIFNMRDKISEGGELGPFLSKPDRDVFNSSLNSAEDWLSENPDSAKTQFLEKLKELKAIGDPAVWRRKEDASRAESIDAAMGAVKTYRATAKDPGTKYKYISRDKLSRVTAACNDLEGWLQDLGAKQRQLPKHEEPVLVSTEIEKRTRELTKLAEEILKANPNRLRHSSAG